MNILDTKHLCQRCQQLLQEGRVLNDFTTCFLCDLARNTARQLYRDSQEEEAIKQFWDIDPNRGDFPEEYSKWEKIIREALGAAAGES